MSIIILGKSGVGKSTLINCLLKENVAEEGYYNVITLETKSYKGNKIPFLNLIDTRGYELNQQYNPDNIQNEVLKTIQEKIDSEDINEFIQCIWYCVNSNILDNSEINALRQLKNNNFHIPLIVVFTHAVGETYVIKMKEQIKNLFPELKFIPVLARETEYLEKYGLDDLLNMTLSSIKSRERNEALEKIEEKYKMKEKIEINDIISILGGNTINKLVEEFINNFNSVLDEKNFEKYFFSFIENLITAFSDQKEISPVTKKIIQNGKTQIQNQIKSYITIYSQLAKKYINKVIDEKSLEFLDIQAKIEAFRNNSIKPKNKRNKEGFQKLISQFLTDNFYYISQKYFIYLFIRDSFEKLSENLSSSIFNKLDNILQSKEILSDYKNIYLKIFQDYEKEIDRYRDSNKKIYN